MERPPRVLLPSDQRDWIGNFAAGYTQLGWEVTTGAFNFDLESINPDVIHFNWPEELTGWRAPNAAQIDATIARLDRWAKRARMIVSVNNLYPHGQHASPIWHRLYTAFYERADVIHHFSHASRDMVRAEYPAIADRNHVVHVGFNYDRMLPAGARDRSARRAEFGIQPDEVVYLVFGALRFWDEVCLLRDAFRRAEVPKKRLLASARYEERSTPLRRRWRQWRWEGWQRSNSVVRTSGYVPDDEVHKLFDAADVAVVIRQNSLSSGVPSLAMTFGKMVIAPNTGGIPEYVAGADNLLYEATSARSLAQAMERAAGLDRERIGLKNSEISRGRTWDRIIRTCLDALPVSPA